jgi:hypothetical protein
MSPWERLRRLVGLKRDVYDFDCSTEEYYRYLRDSENQHQMATLLGNAEVARQEWRR